MLPRRAERLDAVGALLGTRVTAGGPVPHLTPQIVHARRVNSNLGASRQGGETSSPAVNRSGCTRLVPKISPRVAVAEETPPKKLRADAPARTGDPFITNQEPLVTTRNFA